MSAGIYSRVLVADPPWTFGDKLPGGGRGAEKHYDCLSLQEIKGFSLPPLATDAMLLLWRVAAMPAAALQVVHAWGFEPKSELVWVKSTASGAPAMGMGHYVRGSHETCILATRGRFKVRSRAVRSVFEARRGRHSEKPDEFYALVEDLADGPYAELFARRRRPGWRCFGKELEP